MATARRFAEGTAVASTQSLQQIKDVLKRFGAGTFAHAENPQCFWIMFVIQTATGEERRIRYTVWYPTHEAMRPKSRNSATWKLTEEQATERRRNDEIDRLWRALASGIKGKLVLVESGIESIEEAFYANIVVPGADGQTLYEVTSQRIAEGYRTGTLPALLPGIPARTMEIEGTK